MIFVDDSLKEVCLSQFSRLGILRLPLLYSYTHTELKVDFYLYHFEPLNGDIK